MQLTMQSIESTVGIRYHICLTIRFLSLPLGSVQRVLRESADHHERGPARPEAFPIQGQDLRDVEEVSGESCEPCHQVIGQIKFLSACQIIS